jgi:hypothetical protein
LPDIGGDGQRGAGGFAHQRQQARGTGGKAVALLQRIEFGGNQPDLVRSFGLGQHDAIGRAGHDRGQVFAPQAGIDGVDPQPPRLAGAGMPGSAARRASSQPRATSRAAALAAGATASSRSTMIACAPFQAP